MYSLANLTTASVLAAAIGLAPVVAGAQTQATGSTTSATQGTSQSPSQESTPPSSQQSTESDKGTGNQEAVRQHLTAARQSLEELTKLPAAGQLQGEQRTMVSQFISDFNAFATATTDWRGKYQAVDRSLDKILDTESGASASSDVAGSAAGAAATDATPGSADPASAEAGSADAGSFDPAIIAKLREVRTHLDSFEEASGDPIFIVDKLEKALDEAMNASAPGTASDTAVGTSGTASSTGVASSGSVSIDRSKLEEIRRHLERLRTSLER